MSTPSRDALERLAHDAAMQLYRAALAKAGYADDSVPPEDLVHAVAIHRARAEGMLTAAELLLSPAELQHFQARVQAVMRQEEQQDERDLVGAESQHATS